ncbi:hypothetical protein G6F35_018893 [Rhizopus arrhizus]|nr:hypothetical protein G6F35_018893 [Rhizopus arrhizus]
MAKTSSKVLDCVRSCALAASTRIDASTGPAQGVHTAPSDSPSRKPPAFPLPAPPALNASCCNGPPKRAIRRS